jgi:hypothetical protein
MKSKTNIVLVHGAWADGSSWGKVIPFLRQEGFNVTAAQIPLTSALARMRSYEGKKITSL